MSNFESLVWQEALGPFYLRHTLESYNFATEDLITLTTIDDMMVYPGGQFGINLDGNFSRREPVIAIWNEFLLPEVELGVIGPWGAALFLLGNNYDGQSLADIMTLDETKTPDVINEVAQAIAGWRQ